MNLKQRRKLLCLTAASGSVPNLEVATHAAGCLPTPEVFEAAAAAGSLEMCQWLHQQGYPLGSLHFISGGSVLTAAAGGGHTHVCEWLLTLNLAWCGGSEVAALAGGHIRLMEWLRQSLPQPEFTQGKLPAAAARGCSLHSLQHMRQRWGMCHNEQLLAAAAGSPTPDWAAKVEWLEGQGCPRTEAAAEEAAARPDALERLTWLRGRGYPLGSEAVVTAAGHGNTAALHYLLEEGVRPPPDDIERAVCQAAEGGHLAALQALHAAGLPVDGDNISTACLLAAAAGHLHVVAWLVETLGPALLDAALFTAAALSGSVELMAWLRQRGCEWNARVFSGAAESGCEEALEWLVAQGCPMPEDGTPYLTACQQGDPATARCLQRLGVPWGEPTKLVRNVINSQLTHSMHLSPLPMLRWLLEAGCQVDYDAAEANTAALARRWPRMAAHAEEVTQVLKQHRRQRGRNGVACPEHARAERARHAA